MPASPIGSSSIRLPASRMSAARPLLLRSWLPRRCPAPARAASAARETREEDSGGVSLLLGGSLPGPGPGLAPPLSGRPPAGGLLAIGYLWARLGLRRLQLEV